MSVNSVNSIYGTQAMQGSNGYAVSINEDEGSGVDIGKLLLGGAAVVATVGIGFGAYKTGKGSNLAKEGDNVLQTMWNGIKSWFGKNNVKKYVDIDNIDSLSDSQQIAKAQEAVDAAKNNLAVSQNKALNHRAAINDVIISLNDKEQKIDEELLEKIKGIKGLEKAFDLAEDGGSLIIKDADAFNAYFGKRIANFTSDSTTLSVGELNNLLNETSLYYTLKNHNNSLRLQCINSREDVTLESINDIFDNIGDLVTRETSAEVFVGNSVPQASTSVLANNILTQEDITFLSGYTDDELYETLQSL